MRLWLVAAVWTVLVVEIALPAVAHEPTVIVIKVTETRFDPADVIIQKGDAVRWKRESGVVLILSGADNETAGDLFSFPLNSEHPDTTITFSETGLFPFFAQGKAETMSGTITVREAISPVNLATWGKLKTLFERP
jgi:plastocyanin